MNRQIDCTCRHSVDHHIYSKGRCLVCTCPKADGLMTQDEWRKTPHHQSDLDRARSDGADDEHQDLLSQYLSSEGMDDE